MYVHFNEHIGANRDKHVKRGTWNMKYREFVMRNARKDPLVLHEIQRIRYIFYFIKCKSIIYPYVLWSADHDARRPTKKFIESSRHTHLGNKHLFGQFIGVAALCDVSNGTCCLQNYNMRQCESPTSQRQHIQHSIDQTINFSRLMNDVGLCLHFTHSNLFPSPF